MNAMVLPHKLEQFKSNMEWNADAPFINDAGQEAEALQTETYSVACRSFVRLGFLGAETKIDKVLAGYTTRDQGILMQLLAGQWSTFNGQAIRCRYCHGEPVRSPAHIITECVITLNFRSSVCLEKEVDSIWKDGGVPAEILRGICETELLELLRNQFARRDKIDGRVPWDWGEEVNGEPVNDMLNEARG